MADFTGTVPDVNVSAPVQPLQTNTGSAATDVLAAASFGLSLFDRQQTADRNAAIKKQKVDVSKATEAILQKQELDISQGVKGTKLEFSVLDSIQQQAKKYNLNPLDLRKSVASFRGKNTTELLRSAQTAEEKAELQAIEKRKNDELALAENIGYLAPKDGNVNPEELSNDELQTYLLTASGNKSRVLAQQAELDIIRSQTTNSEARRRIDVRSFGDQYVQQSASSIGRQLVGAIGQVDFNNPAELKDGLRMISDLKTQIPNQIRAAANSSGLNLSRTETQELADELNGKLDRFSSMLKREDIAGLNKGMMEERISDIFFSLQTGTPEQQQAADALILSKMVGTPPSLGSFNRYLKEASTSAIGGRFTDATKMKDNTSAFMSPKDKEAAMKYMRDNVTAMYEPMVKDIPQEYKDVVTNGLLKDFSGTQSELKELVQTGGYQAHLAGLSKEYSLLELDPARLQEVRDSVTPLMQDVTSSAISSFLRTPQRTLVTSRKASNAFTIDANTLQVKPKGNMAQHTSQSRGLNNLLQNTIKAYKNLGYSDSEIEDLKTDILMAFGMVDDSNLEHITQTVN